MSTVFGTIFTDPKIPIWAKLHCRLCALHDRNSDIFPRTITITSKKGWDRLEGMA